MLNTKQYKTKAVSQIFTNCNENDDIIDQNAIDCYQLEFLANNSDPKIVEYLFSKYFVCPDLIIDTLMLIIDDPSICNLQRFPYNYVTTQFMNQNSSNMELLLQLQKSKILVINIIYRLNFLATKDNVMKILDIIQDMVKISPDLFENENFWGVSIGPQNETFKKIFILADYNINKNLCYSEVSNDFINDQIFDYIKSKGILKGSQLPFFLCNIFELITGFKATEIIDRNYTFFVSKIHSKIFEIILNLIKNLKIKDRFCQMIQIIIGMDRKKISYVEEENISDSASFLLFHLVLSLGKNILNKDFIQKIDNSKFPTFLFYNINRLMEISILKLFYNIKSKINEKNSLILINYGFDLVQKYLNFVYEVVDLRSHEVFYFLDKNYKQNDSYKSIQVSNDSSNVVFIDEYNIDFGFEPKTATKLCELAMDDSFFDVILKIQSLSTKNTSKLVIGLINQIFKYKNVVKMDAIDILFRMKNTEQKIYIGHSLVGNLLKHYCNKTCDDIVSIQFHINRIIDDIVLDQFNYYTLTDCLRIVSIALGSLEDKISKIFSCIDNINSYKRKVEFFKDLIDSNEEMELSDDEENYNMLDKKLLEKLKPLNNAELHRFIKSNILINYDENIHNEITENIISQVKYYGVGNKLQVYKKIKININRLDLEEKRLESFSMVLDNLLDFFVNFVFINKKLFLNRNVFLRMNLILNSSLNLLVGKDSVKITISKKYENFDPKVFLRKILLILISIYKGCQKLAEKSGISDGLLLKAIELAECKYLLMESQCKSLRDIYGYISSKKIVGEDEANLEDIPDEFLDPLTYIVMEDPVIMLTSNITVDRNTFKQIMLNDQIDPFSRLPLDDSKIKDNCKLKDEIRRFYSKQQ